jgi:hypothetical protein
MGGFSAGVEGSTPRRRPLSDLVLRAALGPRRLDSSLNNPTHLLRSIADGRDGQPAFTVRRSYGPAWYLNIRCLSAREH